MGMDRCMFLGIHAHRDNAGEPKDIASSFRSLQLQVERDLIAEILEKSRCSNIDHYGECGCYSKLTDLIGEIKESKEKEYRDWLKQYS